MTTKQKTIVALLVIGMFIALLAVGIVTGKEPTGAFVGGLIAGFVFEVAQILDRRARNDKRRMARIGGGKRV